MPRILDALPEMYGSLLPDFFTREIPREEKATCANCAMCPDPAVETPASQQSVLFNPDVKCCTYFPKLPNYLVGALLSDDRPEMAEGVRRVLQRIEMRSGVTPQYLRSPKMYRLLYAQQVGGFGRAESLRCPYFETKGGGCTIWPYREAVCSTYYCKYVAGADGRAFWMALKSYLTLAEVTLSRYALHTVAPAMLLAEHERALAGEGPISREDLDDVPVDAGAHAAMWGEHAGREAQFYRDCFSAVRALDSARVQKLIGFDSVVWGALLEKMYNAATTTHLPKLLKLDPSARVKWGGDGNVTLTGYSELDTVTMPRFAYALLTAFTGDEPVETVRARILEERGQDVGTDALRVLYGLRVLTAG